MKIQIELLLLFFFISSNTMVVNGAENEPLESLLYILIIKSGEDKANPNLLSIQKPMESYHLINKGITLQNYVPNSLLISPSGRYLAFLKYETELGTIQGHITGQTTYNCALQLLNSTTNKIIDVTPGNPGEGRHYDWHPTQPAIYYISRENQKAGVYLFDIQSNNIKQMFVSYEDTLELEASHDLFNTIGLRAVRALPSGKGFSYLNGNIVDQRKLNIVDDEGQKYLSDAPPFISSFQWMSDEKRFIYEDWINRIWIYNIDTQTKNLLYKDGYMHVSINPVKNSIALDLNGRIYIWSEGDSNWNRLNTQTDIYYPTWSPDGQYIAYFSERDGKNQIYISDIHGNQHAIISNIIGDIIEIHWGIFSNSK